MKFWTLALIATVLVLSSNANAALIERLGGLAYYDTEADLTWLADANYAHTSGHSADGFMNWTNANNWVAGLDIAGVTGWRLPSIVDVGNDGCNFSASGGTDCGYNVDTSTSELANLFHNVLGNLAYYNTNGYGPQPNWGLMNSGPFSNVQPYRYWTSTEYAPNTFNAWTFVMNEGQQRELNKGSHFNAWAVYTGDVSTVPVPAAVWLFGSGLIGLVGLARRKKA